MKLIIAAFFAAMALVFTWEACYLALGAEHAWKVVSTISAFLFGFGAIAMFCNWVVDGDDF